MYEIKICMGSSCFSRGNSDMVKLINQFIIEHNLQDKGKLEGCLCRNLCKMGPNIEINGKVYNQVTPENIESILAEGLGVEE